MNVAAAVLAAGSSRRLGVPKQLLTLADGSSLVRHSAQSVCSSYARHQAVVVGADAERVSRSLEGLPLEVLTSDDAAEGIAASIRAASAWATKQQAEALLLCVCDQPSLNPAHLNTLLDTWSRAGGLVASHYGGKRAVPAVFPANHFAELQALRGDFGAASILRSASRITLIEWPEGELDLDTASDWLRYQASVRVGSTV